MALTFLIEQREIHTYIKGTKVHTFSLSAVFQPVKFDMTSQDNRKHIIFLNSEIRYQNMDISTILFQILNILHASSKFFISV